jgi:hypothetical protein
VIYLYAYTNHRTDLDSLRRMGALWEILREGGIEAELLVNDYRAQLAGRELGLPPATTIETVLDIDAVAEYGDTVVIDSPEDAGERMGRYVERFARVLRVVPGGGESACGEEVVDPFAPETILYRSYGRGGEGEGTLLLYGDSDASKELLSLSERFAGRGWDLYWGHYFYVKYEDLLAERFARIRESEEYPELFGDYRRILTAMPQSALEAAAAGSELLFLAREGAEDSAEALRKLGIPVVGSKDLAANPQEESGAATVSGIPRVDERYWRDLLGFRS